MRAIGFAEPQRESAGLTARLSDSRYYRRLSSATWLKLAGPPMLAFSKTMNTDHLRLFLTIARCRSLARAAVELDLAQATVSERLKALETEVGARLFERHGRGVTLTPAGGAFRPQAERALDLLRQGQAAALAATEGHGGQVTAAVTVTAGAYLFAPALAAFQRQHPGVEVRVRSVHSWDAPGLLLDGLAHLALVSGTVLHPQIESLVAARAPMALVAGRGRPRASQRLGLNDLAREQWLVSYWGAAHQRFLERVRAAGGGETRSWRELSPVELVKGMLLAGQGISLVPEIAVRRELAAGELVRLRLAAGAGPLPAWEIALLRRRGVAPNPAVEALAAALIASLPQRVRPEGKGGAHKSF
jgi:DNA-binding transcriptional LysR family regulator